MNREELAAALDVIETMDWLPESDDEVIESAEVLVDAARERLAQLPEKRAGRVEFGEHGLSGVFHNVYPAELVERIGSSLDADHSWYRCTGNHDYLILARIALDALNGETE